MSDEPAWYSFAKSPQVASDAVQQILRLCAPGPDLGHGHGRDLPDPDAHAKATSPDPFDIVRALNAGGLDEALAGSIPEGIAVDRVMVTLNWTIVRAGDLCGIARSPVRGAEGARSIRPEARFSSYELRDLARLQCSLDPLARSVGLAAVNAHWNCAEGQPCPLFLEHHNYHRNRDLEGREHNHGRQKAKHVCKCATGNDW